MTYNFDEIIDRRHTNALNTDGFRGYIFHAGPEKVFAFKDEEFVRMWVADMEFAVAPEILDALRARIDRRIFGYTGLYDDEYYRTFSKWCRDHYDWSFPKEQLCVSPGIIPALYQLTETLCGPDEKVLLNTPAYGYFLHAAEYAGVDVLTSPLHKKADGTFEVDYEDFERKCADPACKLVFWCNPHNPTGRMWTEEELHRVAAIIEKYNLWVVSDEIHCDLIRCEPPQFVHAVKIPRRLDIVGHIQDLFERGHIGLAGRVPADGIFYLKWYAETIPGHGSAGFGVQELGVGRFDRIVYDTIFIRQ